MAIWPCHDITREATNVLSDPMLRDTLCDMAAAGVPSEAFADFLADRVSPELSALVREEFREMPSSMIGFILTSWSDALRAGKAFELRSVLPDEPVRFARERRVRLTLDYEADRAAISLSHVPGRHASWYQPAPATAGSAV